MTATATLVGVTVRYHGSITEHHGPARILGVCDCEKCWDAEDYARLVGAPRPAERYELGGIGGDVLMHVRRESFTVPA